MSPWFPGQPHRLLYRLLGPRRLPAWAHYEGGDLERARTLYEEIIREAREAHDPFPEGIALGILGDIALDQGRLQDAVSLTTEGYRIFRDLEDLLMIASAAVRPQLDEAKTHSPHTP